MAKIGRRAGFSLGALIGVVFGAVGCVAIYRQSFPLLCLASLLQGMQGAFFWYFRLAAADATEPQFRAKAISLVMAGGVMRGFLGPQSAKWSVDWLAP
jgi:predicted MFS family arabinose efflux permease